MVRIMIETYKRHDGEVLGANKVGEGSGENEGKIRDIPEPPKTHHKNAYAPKPNHLRNRLDTTQLHPCFLEVSHHTEKVVRVLGLGVVAGRSFARDQYEYGGNDRSFRSQRSYGPRSPIRGTRSPPRGHVGVPPRRDRMDFAKPTFD
jgi:hypothetical protein